MAQVDIGKIKIVWKGAWNSSDAYTVDDAVSLSGSSYICIQAGTNQNPSTATAYWQQMAAKGTDADLINISGTVQGDIYYNNGSSIARLAPGSASQVLQSGGAGANPSWVDASSGKTLNVVQHTNSTRTSLSSTVAYDFFNVTYPQQKANSKILVQALLPGQGAESGNVHMKIIYDSTDYEGVGYYAYSDGGHGQLLHFLHLLNGSSTTGNKTLQLRQQSQSGNQRFASTWNPNGSDDNRLTTSTSSLIITEYDF